MSIQRLSQPPRKNAEVWHHTVSKKASIKTRISDKIRRKSMKNWKRWNFRPSQLNFLTKLPTTAPTVTRPTPSHRAPRQLPEEVRQPHQRPQPRRHQRQLRGRPQREPDERPLVWNLSLPSPPRPKRTRRSSTSVTDYNTDSTEYTNTSGKEDKTLQETKLREERGLC